MNFHIIDTESIYRRLLAANTDAEREAAFQDLLTPYEGLIQIFGGDAMQSMRQWAIYMPEDYANGKREIITQQVNKLAAASAWELATEALEEARNAFAPVADRIPVQDITFGLLLCNAEKLRGVDRGYAGFGGIPGWIMVTVHAVNDYVTDHIKGATAHELFHNVHFSIMPFNPMTATVGQYIVAEGLAESFATELYGAESVGFMVAEFDETRAEESRQIIGAALNKTGFTEIRSYIFGDAIADAYNLPKQGLPDFAGYAIGYKVVQAYLQKTGQNVVDAMFIPHDKIIAESGYFA